MHVGRMPPSIISGKELETRLFFSLISFEFLLILFFLLMTLQVLPKSKMKRIDRW